MTLFYPLFTFYSALAARHIEQLLQARNCKSISTLSTILEYTRQSRPISTKRVTKMKARVKTRQDVSLIVCHPFTDNLAAQRISQDD